ncbi:hypothetical protein [Gallaecimonas xiamenensis]|uniref:Uncharacterized protein n=1 Tax=Gallaecimonas xiamenensis 3-C-1 TaxID=745411 RepID=K2JF83_9GAMM|nr:hypothetical protein [Gallaecimonas xiamenensis]EKE73758.1 hypothetical protein B3C1_10182 [Gallaecimonas xiamenensis 3-C-1]
MDFSGLNKKTAKSFNDQKALIKKVMSGRPMACPQCGKPLVLHPPGSAQPGIRCAKGCTDIALEFD